MSEGETETETPTPEQDAERAARAHLMLAYEMDRSRKVNAYDRIVRNAEGGQPPRMYRAIVIEAAQGVGVEGSIFRFVRHIFSEDMTYLGALDPCPGGVEPTPARPEPETTG